MDKIAIFIALIVYPSLSSSQALPTSRKQRRLAMMRKYQWWHDGVGRVSCGRRWRFFFFFFIHRRGKAVRRENEDSSASTAAINSGANA
jgi:hypothetical protein